MVVFPNAKINIGLNVIEKRTDGFHNLQSVFYPVNIKDSLEVVESNVFNFNISGVGLKNNGNNLIEKAYNKLKSEYNLPPLNIHLHKAIPIEAGLGGGSSDAAFMLNLLVSFFNINISDDILHKFADEIGSDCSFFINNKPAYVTGKGEKHRCLPFFLKGRYIVIIKPNISISTKKAFSNINIKIPNYNLLSVIEKPIIGWRNIIKNDFEEYAFKEYPVLSEIKQFLYKKGANYASMSGSGSAIYGIFDKEPEIVSYKDFFIWGGIL